MPYRVLTADSPSPRLTLSVPLRTIGSMSGVTGGWVPYGRDAAAALAGAIRQAKASEALAPVTVVVASNQVGVSVRRQLASGALGPTSGAGPGLVGVSFATPYRLAELLGAAELAAQGRRPVSTPVLSAAVRSVLGVDAGVFAPVAAHPATEAALVSAYRELRDLSDEALDAVARQGSRTSEVVRVYQATRARLVGAWYDEEDLMAAATGVAGAGTGADGVGSVVVYLPQRLTGHAVALLRAVGAHGGLTVLAGTTGNARADAEVSRSASQLGLVDAPPGSELLPATVTRNRTRIITASDADDEVRAAVRTVVDAAREGTSLDRMAVLHASPEPYGRLLHDHLDSAGVARNGAAEVSLAGRLASRVLLGLLSLPATGYRRQDVFAWVTGAPLLVDGVPVPTSAWERISRTAGVVGGRAHWDELLANLARRLDDAADAAEARASSAEQDDEQEPSWRAERDRADAARARSLRQFVLGLVDRLAAATAPAPWAERVAWAKTLLADVLGDHDLRLRWPEAERRAADRLDLALDRLIVLGEMEGPVSIDVFTRTLEVELESDLGRVGRFGEGILVGPVSMGVGVDLDRVIVVGMAEGTFPVTVRDDSLLPDDDREAGDGELPLRRNHVDRLHHQFLALLGGARAQTLCVPKGDLRRSRDRVPSRWVLDVASDLMGHTIWSSELADTIAPWITHVASFDAGLRTAVPATAQEHRLRRVLHEAPAQSALHGLAATLDSTWAAGVAAVDARASASLTRFDGNLDGFAIPSPIDSGTTSTRLEVWARCPHRYLLQYVLRIDPVEQPEDALMITPIDRGNLVHGALEKFLGEVLAEGRAPDPAQSWSRLDHERLNEITSKLCDQYEQEGLTGRTLFWRRDRRALLAEMTRFLLADDARRAATASRPIAAELGFGLGGSPPVELTLADGRTVALRGRADRVDRSDDGTLHVLDYKTGSARKYQGLDAGDPHQGGRHLQLVVYAGAARLALGQPDAPVRSEYWFTSAKEKFKRLGYVVTDEIFASVGDALATIVVGIEAGLFPSHPQPHNSSPFPECVWCDPDNLGTGDLRRDWDRKLADPTMGPYLALIDPVDEAEEAS